MYTTNIVSISTQRRYDVPTAPYLLTISIPPFMTCHERYVWAYQQAHAVVDDFGTLVIIDRFV